MKVMKCPKCNSDLDEIKNKLFCSNYDCEFSCKRDEFEEKCKEEANKKLSWNLQLADEKNWYTKAFEEYPFVIAHEYKRIKTELEEGSVFGAMLQIKDLFEVLLKYPILIIAAKIFRKENKTTKENEILKELVAKPLSLGDWVRIAGLIEDLTLTNIKLKEDNCINMISFLIKVYDGNSKINKDNMVNWRNSTVGHGALKLRNDVEFIADMKVKVILIKKIFEEIDKYLSNSKLYYKEGKDAVIDLKGNKLLKEIKDLDLNIYTMNNGEEYNLSPFIRFDIKGIYFFDTYIKSKTDILCYPAGHKISKGKDEMKDFHDIYSSFSSSSKNLEISDEIRTKTYDVLKNKMLETIKEVDNYVEPEYMIEMIKTFVENNKKGIMLLQMEGGMGKSTLCRALDEQSRIFGNYLNKVSTRAVYLNSFYLSSGDKMFATIQNKLEEDKNGDRRAVGIITHESDNSKRLSDILNQYLIEHKNLFHCEKLLLIIDGLDETTFENENSIFSYIPKLVDLNDNIYILLTCRTNAELSDYTLSQLVKLKDIYRFEEVKKNSESNIEVLEKYIKLNITTKDEIIKQILQKAKNTFIYVTMMRLFIESGTEDIKSLPEYKDMFSQYVKKIKNIYGNKQGNNLWDILALMAIIYEPITFEELVYLLGEVNPSYKLVAYMEDIKYLLRSERVTGRGTVYSIAHSEIREYIVNNHKDIFAQKIEVRKKYFIDSFKSIVNYLKSASGEALFNYYNGKKNDGEIYILTYIKDYIDTAPFLKDNEHENLMASLINGIYFPPLKNKNFNTYVLKRIIEIMSKKILILNHMNKDDKLNKDLARRYRNRGIAYGNLAMFKEALKDYDKAIEILSRLAEEGKLEDLNDLALVHTSRGITYDSLAMHREALKEHDIAIEISDRLAKESGRPLDLNNLAINYTNRGASYCYLTIYREALKDYEKAIDILSNLTEEGNLRDLNDLACVYMNRGATYDTLSMRKEALKDYEKVIEIRSILALGGKLGDMDDLAKVYMNRGITHRSLAMYKEALEDYEKALEIISRLAEEGKLGDLIRLASLYVNRGVTYDGLTMYKEALIDYEKAIEIMNRQAEEGKLGNMNDLASVYMNRGNTYNSLTMFREALKDHEKVLEIRSRLAEEGKLGDLNELASLYVNRGNTYQGLKMYKEALIDYEKAIEIMNRQAGEGKLGDLNDLASAYRNRGIIYHSLAMYKEALNDYEKAIEIRSTLAEEGKLGDLNELASVHMNRGITYNKLKDFKAALEDSLQALRLFNKIVKERWQLQENFIQTIHMTISFSNIIGCLRENYEEITANLQLVREEYLSERSKKMLQNAIAILLGVKVNNEETLQENFEKLLAEVREIPINNNEGETTRLKLIDLLMVDDIYYGIYLSKLNEKKVFLRFNIEENYIKLEFINDEKELNKVTEAYRNKQ
jgi:tetratricopeptide (TPR) repeat protein